MNAGHLLGYSIRVTDQPMSMLEEQEQPGRNRGGTAKGPHQFHPPLLCAFVSKFNTRYFLLPALPLPRPASRWREKEGQPTATAAPMDSSLLLHSKL